MNLLGDVSPTTPNSLTLFNATDALGGSTTQPRRSFHPVKSVRDVHRAHAGSLASSQQDLTDSVIRRVSSPPPEEVGTGAELAKWGALFVPFVFSTLKRAQENQFKDFFYAQRKYTTIMFVVVDLVVSAVCVASFRRTVNAMSLRLFCVAWGLWLISAVLFVVLVRRSGTRGSISGILFSGGLEGKRLSQSGAVLAVSMDASTFNTLLSPPADATANATSSTREEGVRKTGEGQCNAITTVEGKKWEFALSLFYLGCASFVVALYQGKGICAFGVNEALGISTCTASISLDGCYIYFIGGMALLAPLRCRWFLPAMILMNVVFFAFRLLPGVPSVESVYLESYCIVGVITSLVCIGLVSVTERDYRRKFHLHQLETEQTRELAEVREETQRMVSEQLPFEVMLQGAMESIDRFGVWGWHAEVAVCVIEMLGFVSWSAFRGPCDAVDVVQQTFEALDKMRRWSIGETSLSKYQTFGDRYIVLGDVVGKRDLREESKKRSSENNNYDEYEDIRHPLLRFALLCLAECNERLLPSYVIDGPSQRARYPILTPPGVKKRWTNSHSTKLLSKSLRLCAALDVGVGGRHLSVGTGKQTNAIGPVVDGCVDALDLLQRERNGVPSSSIDRRRRDSERHFSVFGQDTFAIGNVFAQWMIESDIALEVAPPATTTTKTMSSGLQNANNEVRVQVMFTDHYRQWLHTVLQSRLHDLPLPHDVEIVRRGCQGEEEESTVVVLSGIYASVFTSRDRRLKRMTDDASVVQWMVGNLVGQQHAGPKDAQSHQLDEIREYETPPHSNKIKSEQLVKETPSVTTAAMSPTRVSAVIQPSSSLIRTKTFPFAERFTVEVLEDEYQRTRHGFQLSSLILSFLGCALCSAAVMIVCALYAAQDQSNQPLSSDASLLRVPFLWSLSGCLIACFGILVATVVHAYEHLFWKPVTRALFDVLFYSHAATYCAALIVSPRGSSVLGNGELVWLYTLFLLSMSRPVWYGPLTMNVLDVLVCCIFVCLTVARGGSASYISIYLFLTCIEFPLSVGIRQIMEHERRLLFAAKHHVDALHQALSTDYIRLESALRHLTQQQDDEASPLSHNRNRSVDHHAQQTAVGYRNLNPFASVPKDVQFILVELQAAPPLSDGKRGIHRTQENATNQWSDGRASSSLLHQRVALRSCHAIARAMTVVTAAVHSRCDFCRVVKADAHRMLIVAHVARVATNSRGQQQEHQDMRDNQKHTRELLHLATKELPQVISALVTSDVPSTSSGATTGREDCREMPSPEFAAEAVGSSTLEAVQCRYIAHGGPLVGCVTGGSAVSFDYYGPSLATATSYLQLVPWDRGCVSQRLLNYCLPLNKRNRDPYEKREEARGEGGLAACEEDATMDSDDYDDDDDLEQSLRHQSSSRWRIAGLAPLDLHCFPLVG